MNAAEALRRATDYTYSQFLQSIEGLSEQESWAGIAPKEGDYLHSTGTIIGIVQHVAGCKFLYGSWVFRSRELRLRDIFARTRALGSSWEATKEFLAEGQSYWADCLKSLHDADLDVERETHMRVMPTWRILSITIGHDEYHAGQIQLIRSTQVASEFAPDMGFDEEEAFLKGLEIW